MRSSLLAILGTYLVVLTPLASGLGVVDADEPGTIRLILDAGTATVQALEGAPRVDGEAVPEETTALPEERVEPWRGYDRTVRVALGGTGRVLFADDASGVVATIEAQANATGQAAPDERAGHGEAGAGPSDEREGSASERPGAQATTGPESATSPAPGPEGSPQGATPGTAPMSSTPGGASGEARESPQVWSRSLLLTGLAALALAAPFAWRWYREEPADPDPPASSPRPASTRPSWAQLPTRAGRERLNPPGHDAGARRHPGGDERPRSRARARSRPAARRHSARSGSR